MGFFVGWSCECLELILILHVKFSLLATHLTTCAKLPFGSNALWEVVMCYFPIPQSFVPLQYHIVPEFVKLQSELSESFFLQP